MVSRLERVVKCASGIAIMFFAFRVSDEQLGRVFLWGGMVVGYSGMTWSLLSAYVRAEKRGDI